LNMLPHFLEAHRLLSESLAAGTMASVGDFLAQRKENSRNRSGGGGGGKYDPIRTSHFCFKGLGEGIMWSFWYRMVEQWSKLIAKTLLSSFPKLQMFESALKIAICIVMDLLLACPLIYGLWDIPVPALLRGERNIIQQIRTKLFEMVYASCKVWLPVNIVIYNMPVEYRVYLCSAADVFWQSIVSSISSRPINNIGNGNNNNNNDASMPKAFD
jgi:Mpv17 / PMP22 family